MTKKPWFAGVVLVVLLVSCDGFDENDTMSVGTGGPAAAEAEIIVRSEQEPVAENRGNADCPFVEPAGYAITCGSLAVPENRARADSPTIHLAYAIVHAAEDQGRPPLVYLAGGPGGSGLDDFVSDPEAWDYPFTRTRDLILLDQRGTGYSQPSLDCPELAEDVAFADENPDEACQRRLVNAGIDLGAYNTSENAADVEALRQVLGVDSWDLLGVSYGTRLALAIMRDYPHGIRSAVLDSVFPPNADTPGEEALAPLWSLQRLFAECAADPYCGDVYPDLESAFLETVLALNNTPQDGVYGDDVVFIVTSALNDTALIPLVPAVIDAVARGDVGALEEIDTTEGGAFARRYQGEEDRSDSEGMYNSVICHDEYIFGDYENAEAKLVAAAPEALEAALLQPVADLFRVCSFWGAGAAAAVENAAVVSDIPTLMLAGQYDSATPLAWARLALQTLDNAFLYEFPGAGHSLLSGEECAIAITSAFLDAPQQAPNSDCLQSIDWPYFE